MMSSFFTANAMTRFAPVPGHVHKGAQAWLGYERGRSQSYENRFAHCRQALLFGERLVAGTHSPDIRQPHGSTREGIRRRSRLCPGSVSIIPVFFLYYSSITPPVLGHFLPACQSARAAAGRGAGGRRGSRHPGRRCIAGAARLGRGKTAPSRGHGSYRIAGRRRR